MIDYCSGRKFGNCKVNLCTFYKLHTICSKLFMSLQITDLSQEEESNLYNTQDKGTVCAV